MTQPARIRRGRARWSDLLRDERGMTTAEYAVGTVAACAFAAVLFEVVRSGEVRGLLLGLVQHALHLAG